MEKLGLEDREPSENGGSPAQTRRLQSQRLVRQWQRLAVDSEATRTPKARALLSEILKLSEPLVRQFFVQMIAEDSLGELDDLVNATLSRLENKLGTYDSSKSAFESWLKYQCVRPIFKQHLEDIGYRTVKLDAYATALQARLDGSVAPPTNLIGRLVQSLSSTAAVRNELNKTRQLIALGRKVVLKRDPRLVPALSLNRPARPSENDDQGFDLPAPTVAAGIEESCREQLQQSLSCLSAGERMVIVGLFFAGRSRKELAEEAGISTARVSQLLQQAYKRLRQALGPAFFQDCIPDS